MAKIEIHRIPVISTAHLTKEVAELLTRKRNNNPWLPCVEWEYGYLLHFGDLEARGSKAPKCLIDIANWLTASHFDDRWVRLDSDADVQDDLPYYDW